MSNVRLELLDQVDQLDSILGFWRERAPSPMQSPEWMLAWWSAFKSPAARLTILVAYGLDGQIVGIAPFFTRDHWALGRNLRFLGSGSACSDFQSLITASGYEVAVAESIGQFLLSTEQRESWSFVELEGTASNDLTVNTLIAALRKQNCVVKSVELENTWRLDLSDGWESLLARLSKTQRRQTRNYVNRFDKSSNLTLRFVDQPSELGAALHQCMDLHQRRWQAIGQKGCFADHRFQRFVETAWESLTPQGRASMALLEENGIPIACHIYLRDAAGNLFQYQSGRDPNRESDRIGNILNAIAIRKACQDGLSFIDFLRGNEIYKERAGAVGSKCLRTRIVAPALIPRVRHSVWELGREVKQSWQAWRKPIDPSEKEPQVVGEQTEV